MNAPRICPDGVSAFRLRADVDAVGSTIPKIDDWFPRQSGRWERCGFMSGNDPEQTFEARVCPRS